MSEKNSDLPSKFSHIFVEYCPRCPPRGRKSLKGERGNCRMRCPGTTRGPCGMPLRTVEQLTWGSCTTCRFPQEMPVELTGAFALAEAVVAQVQGELLALRALSVSARPKNWADQVTALLHFLAQTRAGSGIWGQLGQLAALRAGLSR